MSIEKLTNTATDISEGRKHPRAWYDQQDLFDLLEAQRTGSEIALYASVYGVGQSTTFIQSLLLPLKDLEDYDGKELIHWGMLSSDSWVCGLETGDGIAPRVVIGNPFNEEIWPDMLENSQQITFRRVCLENKKRKVYYEISQMLAHAHGLHWLAEHQAWGWQDKEGNVEKVIRILEKPGDSILSKFLGADSVYISMDREKMELHLSATGTALVQLFTSTYTPDYFQDWDEKSEDMIVDENLDLYYAMAKNEIGSFVIGAQVIRPAMTAEEYGAYLIAKKEKSN